MNAFHYQAGELFCEDVPVAQLAEEYGTPLWVYSKSAFLGRLKEIQDAFAEVDPVICYSVKANGNLNILKTMNDAGSSFDVVSGGELFRVQQAGADTSRVVFAGVGKTDDEIRQALKADILMFDVESEAELDAIAAVAEELGCVGRVALRLNPDIDAKTHHKTTTGKRGTSSEWTSNAPRNWPTKSSKMTAWSLPEFICTSDLPFFLPTLMPRRLRKGQRSSSSCVIRATTPTG